MQSKLEELAYPRIVNTQVTSHTKFYLLGISKNLVNHPTAKYLTLRQHINNIHKINYRGQFYGKLKIIPLSSFGNRELVNEKFSNAAPANEVIINSERSGRHRRIGALPPSVISQSIHRSSSTSKSFHLLNYQESRWIECTTINKISAIQLDVQDKYSQTFTPVTTNKSIPLSVMISFADIPEDTHKNHTMKRSEIPKTLKISKSSTLNPKKGGLRILGTGSSKKMKHHGRMIKLFRPLLPD